MLSMTVVKLCLSTVPSCCSTGVQVWILQTETLQVESSPYVVRALAGFV